MLDKSVSLATFKKIVSKVSAKTNTNLGDLTTDRKDTLVAAINELRESIDALRKGSIPEGKELTESWESLNDRIVEGDFHGIRIGDYKTITLTTGENITMEVAGIDPYYNDDYVMYRHHVDFISRNTLNDCVCINSTNNNNGTEKEKHPWNASELYDRLNNTTTGIYATLPEDLKPYISAKYGVMEERYSSNGKVTQDTGYSTAVIGKLWLPTEIEVFGHSVFSEPGYGSAGYGCNCQYPIFNCNKMHTCKRSTEGRRNWWLASASYGDNDSWCIVKFGGSIAVVKTSFDDGSVPLCFRIGAYNAG